MGYFISSVYAVSPTDTHTFFIYFIPSARDQYDDDNEFAYLWVNEWMAKNFQQIAERVGPHKGVIIAPSPKHDERYLESLLRVKSGGAFFSSIYPQMTGKLVDDSFKKDEHRFHFGYPYIIFSRTPIHEGMNKNEAVAIRLSKCKNEEDLGKVFDVLLSIIRSNDMSKLERLDQVLGAQSANKSVEIIGVLNNAVDLKPNFFGLGVNFNYLLQKLAEAIMTRTKSK